MKRFFSKDYALVAAAMLIALGGAFLGQRFNRPGQLGDERIYLAIARNFYEVVIVNGIDAYWVQRTLPSGVAHYTLKLLGLAPNTKNIFHAFVGYNILLSMLIAHFWGLVSRELQLSLKGRWLGFFAIFLNYQMMKHIPFIQITTDLYAYGATIALVYFYLSRNLTGLAVTTVIGSLAWPTVVYVGCAFILFPREEHPATQCIRAPFKLNWVPALAVSGFGLWYLLQLLPLIFSRRIFSYGIFSMGANTPYLPLVYLSMGVSLIYLLYALATLFDSSNLFSPRYILGRMRLNNIIAMGLVMGGIKILMYCLASSPDSRTMMYLLANLFMESIIQPGCFLVSHALFFGPGIILAVFLWKPLCKLIHQHGLGLMIAFFILAVFFLDSESRKQMTTYPVLVPFIIKVIDDLHLRDKDMWSLGAFSLLLSKFWWRIDPGPWTGGALNFPAQSYYMTMGPWMSHSMYVVQGIGVAAIAVAIYFMVIRPKKIAARMMKKEDA